MDFVGLVRYICKRERERDEFHGKKKLQAMSLHSNASDMQVYHNIEKNHHDCFGSS